MAEKTASDFGSDSSCFLSIVNDYCEKNDSAAAVNDVGGQSGGKFEGNAACGPILRVRPVLSSSNEPCVFSGKAS